MKYLSSFCWSSQDNANVGSGDEIAIQKTSGEIKGTYQPPLAVKELHQEVTSEQITAKLA